MSFAFLDNLSDISWNQDSNSHEDLDHNQTLATLFVDPEHLSVLQPARQIPSKSFSIFLYVFQESNDAVKKQFFSVNIKLSKMTIISNAISELISEFETILKDNNAPFSLIEDPQLWEIRIAKKSGFPKDYIPAIDSDSLVQSIEKYDSLALCPVNQEKSITMTTPSLSGLSYSTKESSKEQTPKINHKQTIESLILDSKEFEESKNSSQLLTSSTLNQIDLPRDSHSEKDICLAHYQQRAFQLDNESDQKITRKQQEITPKIDKQKQKQTGFFSMFCY